jgi:hypothetical protein
MSTTPAPDDLVEIATALENAGADLAALRMSSEDAVAATSAYAALLAARADVNACLAGPPPPPVGGSDEIGDAQFVERLSHLHDALARYARTHNGPPALACARAALYVDDARAHLAGEAS